MGNWIFNQVVLSNEPPTYHSQKCELMNLRATDFLSAKTGDMDGLAGEC